MNLLPIVQENEFNIKESLSNVANSLDVRPRTGIDFEFVTQDRTYPESPPNTKTPMVF